MCAIDPCFNHFNPQPIYFKDPFYFSVKFAKWMSTSALEISTADVNIHFTLFFVFCSLRKSTSASDIFVADVDIHFVFLLFIFYHIGCRHSFCEFQLRMSTSVSFFFTIADVDIRFIFFTIVDVHIRFANFSCGCQHLFPFFGFLSLWMSTFASEIKIADVDICFVFVFLFLV